MGSLGDLHPMMALGLELRCRGHSVVINTWQGYREKIVDNGLEFAPLRPDLDPSALRHGNVYAAGAAFGVDAGADHERSARGQGEMGRGEVAARIGRDREPGMAGRETLEAMAVETLDRLEAQAREARDPGHRPTVGRFQPDRPSGGT